MSSSEIMNVEKQKIRNIYLDVSSANGNLTISENAEGTLIFNVACDASGGAQILPTLGQVLAVGNTTDGQNINATGGSIYTDVLHTQEIRPLDPLLSQNIGVMGHLDMVNKNLKFSQGPAKIIKDIDQPFIIENLNYSQIGDKMLSFNETTSKVFYSDIPEANQTLNEVLERGNIATDYDIDLNNNKILRLSEIQSDENLKMVSENPLGVANVEIITENTNNNFSSILGLTKISNPNTNPNIQERFSEVATYYYDTSGDKRTMANIEVKGVRRSTNDRYGSLEFNVMKANGNGATKNYMVIDGNTDKIVTYSDLNLNWNRCKNVLFPVDNEDGANKQYVDNKIGEWSASPATNTINANYNKITNLGAPQNDEDATTRIYVDTMINETVEQWAYAPAVGPINANNNKIQNVATPTNAQDAVNKSYTDSEITSKLGNWSTINAVSDVNMTRHGLNNTLYINSDNTYKYPLLFTNEGTIGENFIDSGFMFLGKENLSGTDTTQPVTTTFYKQLRNLANGDEKITCLKSYGVTSHSAQTEFSSINTNANVSANALLTTSDLTFKVRKDNVMSEILNLGKNNKITMSRNLDLSNNTISNVSKLNVGNDSISERAVDISGLARIQTQYSGASLPLLSMESSSGVPHMHLYANKSVSVNGDRTGQVNFYANDNLQNKKEYARIRSTIKNNDSDVWSGSLELCTQQAGNSNIMVELDGSNNRVSVNPNQTVSGAGSATNPLKEFNIYDVSNNLILNADCNLSTVFIKNHPLCAVFDVAGNYTLTLPTFNMMRVLIIGGGGSGGSGCKFDANAYTGIFGGSAGSSGNSGEIWISRRELFSDSTTNFTFYITVGRGGAKAIGPTTDNTDGQNGNAGEPSFVSIQAGFTNTASLYYQALGGNGGQKGGLVPATGASSPTNSAGANIAIQGRQGGSSAISPSIVNLTLAYNGTINNSGVGASAGGSINNLSAIQPVGVVSPVGQKFNGFSLTTPIGVSTVAVNTAGTNGGFTTYSQLSNAAIRPLNAGVNGYTGGGSSLYSHGGNGGGCPVDSSGNAISGWSRGCGSAGGGSTGAIGSLFGIPIKAGDSGRGDDGLVYFTIW
jgi:hypothetical protein